MEERNAIENNQITLVFQNKKDLILALFTVGILFSSILGIVGDLLRSLNIPENIKVFTFGIALICMGVYGVVTDKVLLYNRASSRMFKVVINGLIILFGIAYIFIISL